MKHKIISYHKFITGLFFLLFLLWKPLTAFALEVPSLVETQWLGDNLKRADIRLIYIGDSSTEDRADFNNKHVPNSLYLSRKELNAVFIKGTRSIDKGKFEILVGRLGISNDTGIVLYDKDGDSISTTFVFWVMKYAGHRDIGILNGGITKWIKEKRKTTDNPLSVEALKYKAAIDGSIRADADYVRKNLKNPQVIILDTRSPDEYTGKEKMGNRRRGHIPGAVNIAFHKANLNDDGTFKAASDIKAVYESKGVTKDKEIITYCQGGVRASHTYFVLKHLLGYPKVRVYAESMGEWANKWNFIKYPMKKGS
ncbi:MAG: sulfurtransferase [Nitrospirae bacterium]|nr:sulfurtransferase [Nitrospirota bacterium]